MAAKHLDIETTKRYVRQANFAFNFAIGPSIIQRDYGIWRQHLWGSGRYGGARGGVPSARLDETSVVLTVDGKPIATLPPDSHKNLNATAYFGSNLDIAAQLPADLALGEHQMHLCETVVLRDGNAAESTELARLPVDVGDAITLIALRQDVGIAQRIRRQLSITAVQTDKLDDTGVTTHELTLTVHFHGEPSPLPFVYDIDLPGVPESAWRPDTSIGSIACKSGVSDQQWVLTTAVSRSLSASMQLHLRPEAMPYSAREIIGPGDYTLLSDEFTTAEIPVSRPPVAKSTGD